MRGSPSAHYQSRALTVIDGTAYVGRAERAVIRVSSQHVSEANKPSSGFIQPLLLSSPRQLHFWRRPGELLQLLVCHGSGSCCKLSCESRL